MIDERLADKLIHMRDAARQASAFIDGMEKQEFLTDARTRDACCMNLIVIGEATKRIVDGWPEFVSERSNFGWNRMTGMRNRVAHGYDGINFEVVWDTLVTELPELIARIDQILEQNTE